MDNPNKEGEGKQEKQAVKSWLEQGKQAGLKLAAMLQKGETEMRKVLLKFAALLCEKGAGEPARLDWLAGYAQAWDSENVRKVRKSEAKTVFESFIVEGEVELAITARFGATNEQMALAKAGTPVKEKHTRKEWLEKHTGSYHDFIALARELAPRATDSSTQGSAAPRGKKLTTKQETEIKSRLASAKPGQLSSLLQSVASAYVGRVGFEIMLFRDIEGICNTIKSKSQDQGFIKGAADILDVAHDLVDRAMRMAAANAAITATNEASKGAVPAPATASAAPAAPAEQPEAPAVESKIVEVPEQQKQAA